MLLRRYCAWSIVGFCFIAFGAQAQESAEIEELKRQFQREIQMLTEAFNEKLADLEAKHKALEEQVSHAEPAQGAERSPTDLRVFWRDSLRLETDDGKFKLRIGGRIHLDTAFFDQDDDLRFIWNRSDFTPLYVDTEDAVDFRRARVYLSGTVYENVEFKAEYDFAGGDADFRDVFIALNDIPYVGQLKVGHFKEPFSLDELTGANYITFMERALPNVFAPSRNVGIQLSNNHLDGRMSWAVGVFRETNDFGSFADDGDYNVSARITGLPIYLEEGRKLLHVGAAYSHKNPDDSFRYRQRPETGLTPVRFVDTGNFRADDIDLIGLELAGVYGPFSLQGEYMWADVDTTFRGNADLDGYYLQASYFLTGEHRPYSMSNGTFGAVKPKKNFKFTGEDRGWGGWELALRYSSLDLDDSSLWGGEEDNITLGLNWYLNPATRIMFNYVHADIDHALYGGDLNIFQTRFQFYF